MSTSVSDTGGRSSSLSPEPDDGAAAHGEPQPAPVPEQDSGLTWVQAEMQRRMAANRTSRGRHARPSGDLAPRRSHGPRHAAEAQELEPPGPEPPDSELADPDSSGPGAPGSTTENGSAAPPAALHARRNGQASELPLSPAGLPLRRPRRGPGTPLTSDGTPTIGPWLRPAEPWDVSQIAPRRRVPPRPNRTSAPPSPPAAPTPAATAPAATAPAATAPAAPSAPAVPPPPALPTPPKLAEPPVVPAEITQPPVNKPPIAEPPVVPAEITQPPVNKPPIAEPVVAPPPVDQPAAPGEAAAPEVAAPEAVAPPATAPPGAPPPTAAPRVGAPPVAHPAVAAAVVDAERAPGGAPPDARSTGTTSPGTVHRPPARPTPDPDDPPTTPHPAVAARRVLVGGRPVDLSAQRRSDRARVFAPRPITPRTIPVVGTTPSEPGSTRVRVVLSERKGAAQPVRTIKEVQEGTAVGDLLRRDLIRSQLSVTLRFAALVVVVLAVLPALFTLLPDLGRSEVLGVRLPWLLLGLLAYPFLVAIAWWYCHVADRKEQDFADHVQD